MATKNRNHRKHWNRVPAAVKAAWVEKKIAEKHEERANDPVLQAKIDAQAVVLLRERMEEFGADWEAFSAIRIPAAVREEIDRLGWEEWLKGGVTS